jgi:hypothetical protein
MVPRSTAYLLHMPELAPAAQKVVLAVPPQVAQRAFMAAAQLAAFCMAPPAGITPWSPLYSTGLQVFHEKGIPSQSPPPTVMELVTQTFLVSPTENITQKKTARNMLTAMRVCREVGQNTKMRDVFWKVPDFYFFNGPAPEGKSYFPRNYEHLKNVFSFYWSMDRMCSSKKRHRRR